MIELTKMKHMFGPGKKSVKKGLEVCKMILIY